MKRSSTSESVKNVVECEEKASISSNSITISSQTDTNKSVENLIKSVNKLSIDFQVVDYSSIKGPTSPTTPKAVDLSACRHKSVSDEKVNLANSLDVVDPHHLKSKSMTDFASCVSCGSGDTLDEPKKLISPYGDWCAFSGGAGSGGCIFTGPYEPMIVPKGDWSDESFESTEESDATVDFCETAGYTHNNFQNTEVVWAKRPGLPWFPGIIIDPHSMCNKDVKAIIKDVGSSLPNKDQLCDFTAAVINTRQTDKLFLVNLFNRKRTWIWLAESKLRPFCKENDKLFLDHSEILHSSYKKELAKAYKKGKKYYIDGEEHVIARKLVHRHHHLFF